MQTNANVIRNEVQTLPLDWEETRGWAKNKLHAAGGAVAGVAAFLGFVGLVEYALYRMVENWTVTGVGASVFGFF